MDINLDNPIYNLIGAAADTLGMECYAVGGVVRDYFLARPCNDIDVVCVGSGIALAEEVARRLGDISGHVPEVHIFRNFGTAQIHCKSNHFYPSDKNTDFELEFVGARRESYHRDSRKPIVEDGTLEDDQNRRDFTVNAMAVCLNEARFGELVDPFGGIKDLDQGILRTPLDPDVTFSDDPLRMMRAIRFASQLGFRIEDRCFEAIHSNAERLKIISQERITTEFNKILLSPHPSLGIKLLEKSELLPIFFPELQKLKGVETINGRSHKDNFYHTLEVLDNVALADNQRKQDEVNRSGDDNTLWLRWAALLHDIGKPATKRYDEKIGWTFHGHEVKGSLMVKKIFKRMRLPLDNKMKYVEKLVLLHLRPIVISEDVVTDSAVRRLLFEAGDDIDDLMLLCEADITSKKEEKKKRFRDNYQLVRRKLVELEEKDRIRNFQPPVSGLDIMETFGIGPCHEIGVIKDAIKDAILDGKIPNDREAAWKMMLDEGKKLGLKQSDVNANHFQP